MANAPAYEHFEHQADMGVRGYGHTREEAFEQVALALTAVIVPPDVVKTGTSVQVTCSAPDDELLLLDWLGTVVYQMSVRKMLFGQFKVALDGCKASYWASRSMSRATSRASRSKRPRPRSCA